MALIRAVTAGGNDDNLRDVSYGGDPRFSLYYLLGAEMRLILALLLIFSFSVSAAYTTMTMEGVKQANGVWTAAGVMDTQGFVRTTGAVTVAGTTRNLPVAMAVDVSASSVLLKGASRALGPIALAATAYDVYSWYTSTGIQSSGDEWTSGEQDYINGQCSSMFGPSSYPVADIPTCRAYVQSFTTRQITTIKKSTNYAIWNYNDSIGTLGQFKNYTVINKPVTQQQIDSIPLPSLPVLAQGFNQIPSLIGSPVPITGVSFTPFSEWASDPYFKDGIWVRDRMDVSPCPTASNPTRVCIDFGTEKFEGATDPTKVPSQATGTATGTAPKDQQDFCKINPHSISCQEMGEAEADPLVPDEKQFTLDTSQSWGAANGACPASPSVTLFTGKVITFNYQPTCDFLSLLRPIIIAFALMTAVFIALGRAD